MLFPPEYLFLIEKMKEFYHICPTRSILIFVEHYRDRRGKIAPVGID